MEAEQQLQQEKYLLDVMVDKVTVIGRRIMMAYKLTVNAVFLFSVYSWICRHKEMVIRPKSRYELLWELVIEHSQPLVVVGVVVASIVVALLVRRSRRPVRRAIMRLRGVSLEAMREGSDFRAGDQPKFQVAILRPGLLSDSHYGYGIRVGDFLVTPEHVVAGMPEVILSANGNKVQVPTVPMLRSRAFSDLVYIRVSDVAWSRLAIRTAVLSQKTMATNLFVSVYGQKGVSSGLLSKSQMVGLLVYHGSTVPGMSGAAYTVGNAVYGIHCGVVANENMGVASLLLAAELKRYMIGEASEDFAAQDIWKSQPKKTWDSSDVFKVVERRFKYTDEEQGEMLARGATWGQVCEWADESIAGAMATKPKTVKPHVTIEDGTIAMKMHPQGGSESGEEMTILAQLPAGASPKASNTYQAEEVIADLVRRVLELERRMDRVEHPMVEVPLPEAKRQFYSCTMCSGKFTDPVAHARLHEKPICPQCGISCTDEQAVRNHLRASHPQRIQCDRCGVTCRSSERLARHRKTCIPMTDGSFTKESADQVDSRKVVRTAGAFLGKKASRARRSASSTRSSSSSDKSPPCPSRQDYLKLILESQRSTQLALENLLSSMTGPSSGILQS
ncbi:hypothetical protein 1 [Hubei sobemo-like virus 20]|uniref:hypothetical protein 1 n=1 Tax=Hubei sobemo-like virus 20 TaxID=1923206 RepID=UPI0009095736|nr:hypothetical protein 1 [Hubei sobemo-like virus 20]APG75721.1 hypothetical protein 1 [Hubei sobemo-like virus 20]